MKSKSRKIKLQKNYSPKITTSEEVEIYPNGVFNFFISAILLDIKDGLLKPKKIRINIENWLKNHSKDFHNLNEEHLQKINTSKAIIQAEISPNKFEIIDGNHRFEKAFRNGQKTISSYKLYVEDLIPYFYDKKGYETFVKYWNEKVDDI